MNIETFYTITAVIFADITIYMVILTWKKLKDPYKRQ